MGPTEHDSNRLIQATKEKRSNFLLDDLALNAQKKGALQNVNILIRTSITKPKKKKENTSRT